MADIIDTDSPDPEFIWAPHKIIGEMIDPRLETDPAGSHSIMDNAESCSRNAAPCMQGFRPRYPDRAATDRVESFPNVGTLSDSAAGASRRGIRLNVWRRFDTPITAETATGSVLNPGGAAWHRIWYANSWIRASITVIGQADGTPKWAPTSLASGI